MPKKCDCPYCGGACKIMDEYSEEGGTCAKCFEEHTYWDEADEVYYPLLKEEVNA